LNEKQNWTEKLGKFITMAGNAILMNLLFLAACLPVVTIGPAWCALLSAIRYNIRGDSWFQGFKFGYKTRFWRSLISWCICLPVCMFFLNDVNNALAAGSISAVVISCLFFAMAAMVTSSLLILNVYIPTDFNNWFKNAVNFFRHPLELLGAAVLFWAPVLIALLWNMMTFLQLIMIFIAVYFTLAALCSTMLLKNGLLRFLTEARAEGILLAEEGAGYVPEE